MNLKYYSLSLIFLVFSLYSGNFWKQEWSKDFKRREEFVADLHEGKNRESVAEYIVRRGQEREADLFQKIIKNAVKDVHQQDEILAKFKKLNNYRVPASVKDNKLTIGKAPGITREDAVAAGKLLRKFGVTGYIHLEIDKTTYARTGIDDSGKAYISVKDSSILNMNHIMIHELCHIACKHNEKIALLKNLSVDKQDSRSICHLHEYLADSFLVHDVRSIPELTKGLDIRQNNRWFKYLPLFFKQLMRIIVNKIDTMKHPSHEKRIRNLDEIRRLVEAEQKWFNTAKADAMYGEAYYNLAEYEAMKQRETQHGK